MHQVIYLNFQTHKRPSEKEDKIDKLTEIMKQEGIRIIEKNQQNFNKKNRLNQSENEKNK